MSFSTDKLSATDYVELPSLTTAEIDAAILAAELPAGSLVYNSDTAEVNTYNGVEITPVVFSPFLSNTVVLTETDVQNLNTIPITLVPAPGTGFALSYQGGISRLTYGSAPFDFSASLTRTIMEGDTSQFFDNGVGLLNFNGMTANAISYPGYSGANSVVYLNTAAENKALQIFDQFGPPTGGTGCTIEITTFYSLITL